jgi:hypothetical protein
MKLLTEGQTVALDMFFTPHKHYQYTGKEYWIWTELLVNQDELLSKKMSSFAGYCLSQAAKYGLKGSNLEAYERTLTKLKTLDPNEKLAQHLDTFQDFKKKF